MKRTALLLFLVLAFALLASAQETQIKWLGHAAYKIITPKGSNILIDPWISNPKNPSAADGKDPLAAITKADYILLTHGHRDHVGESVQIAKKTGALLICNPELAGNLIKLTGFPEKQASPMGIGGEIEIAGGEVTVAMVPAVHTSSVFNPNAGPAEAERTNGGNPAGFVVKIKNGPTLYHTGDTAYFSDMTLIGEQYIIDLALINIGGRTAMEPKMAARTAETVHAKLAVPNHFSTDEDQSKNRDVFAAELKRLKIPFYEMKPGEVLIYRGTILLKDKR